MKSKIWKDVAHQFSGANWSLAMLWIMTIGLFIQISGKVWIASGGARNTQIYLWLLLPVAIYSIYRVFSRSISIDKVYVPWLFFLGWVALSTYWSSDAETSQLSLAKRALFISLYLFSIYKLVNSHSVELRRALMAAVIMVSIGAFVSLIYQYGFLNKPISYRAFRIDRMGIGNFANYGWPVAAGIFNGSIATWAFGFALDKKKLGWVKFFWLLMFIVLTIYVLMTGTRGAWFALLGGCIAAVLIHRSRIGIALVLLSLLSLIILCGLFWDKIVLEVAQRQLSGRGPIWEYYFNVMTDHWWLGHGLGTPFVYLWPNGKTISPHAHSLYLQQVYDSGLVSLSLLVLGVSIVAFKAWKFRHNAWIRLASPPLVFALIAMLTDVERIITRPGDYWTVFWLPVALILAVPDVIRARRSV
ncbi:O-antigen ligase family protein [Pseudomonas putida]|uniref:O-antigen ligase family protein n=1 Tax=Pseudomonas putida TaxID=303 RepID=UPI003CFCE2B7